MAELVDFYTKLAGLATIGGQGPIGPAGGNAAAIMGTPGLNDVSVGAQGPAGYPLLVSAYAFNGNNGLNGFVGNDGLAGLPGTQGAPGANRPYTPYATIITDAGTQTLGALSAAPRPCSLDVIADDPVTISFAGYVMWSGTRLHTTVNISSSTPIGIFTLSPNPYRVMVAEL